MGDLSAHFSKREFACRCGCGYDTPDPELVRGLEALRGLLPCVGKHKRPVFVTSGCRCSKHNAHVGGQRDSQHLFGKAADIYVKGMTPAELYWYCAKVHVFDKGGIGVYPRQGFVHVDVRKVGPARWGKLPRKGFVPIQEALKVRA